MKPNYFLFRNLGDWYVSIIDTSSGTPPMLLLPPSLVGATYKIEALAHIDPTKEYHHYYCLPPSFAPLALLGNVYYLRYSNIEAHVKAAASYPYQSPIHQSKEAHLGGPRNINPYTK